MKTYKRYVMNQTYPEGCITECYLMEESMLYAMNYMPDSIQRSHKQGLRKWKNDSDEYAYPVDKNGKVYNLSSVQYQQVRTWVLQHYNDNAEWER